MLLFFFKVLLLLFYFAREAFARHSVAAQLRNAWRELDEELQEAENDTVSCR